MKGPFEGDVIFIDGTSYNFKTKSRIKTLIIDGGGQVSFSLNKKVIPIYLIVSTKPAQEFQPSALWSICSTTV
jgi:hypothetical protein